jgi:hypothetical protein
MMANRFAGGNNFKERINMPRGKLTPEQLAYRAQRVREACATRVTSEEQKRIISETAKARWKSGGMDDVHKKARATMEANGENEERRIRALEAHLKGIGVGSKQAREKINETLAPFWESQKGKLRTAEKCRRGGDLTQCQKIRTVRDPRGRVWSFKNIPEFVYTHQDLFDPKDLIPSAWAVKKGKRQAERSCNAASNLRNIVAPNTTSGSWKGWTVVSIEEDGKDLLGRNSMTVDEALKDIEVVNEGQ